MGGHACARWATLPRFDCVICGKSAYPPRLCVRADIAPVGPLMHEKTLGRCPWLPSRRTVFPKAPAGTVGKAPIRRMRAAPASGGSSVLGFCCGGEACGMVVARFLLSLCC